MRTNVQKQLAKLYQEDFVLWVDKTLQQLQNQDIENIDWEHLIEEVEGLGSEQRHKVDSYLLQILIHLSWKIALLGETPRPHFPLLLYQYWETEKEYCMKGWKDEIGNFRVQLEFLFESTTLYNHFLKRIDSVYQKARKRAVEKTEMSSNIFPQTCPFTPEQIIDSSFFPN